MEFLDQMKREIGDICYFITSPSELPHVSIRLKGQIVNKEAIRETLYYHIAPLEVLENRDNIIEFMHGNKFQTVKIDSGHGIKKRIKCFDVIMNDPENFNDELHEMLATHPFKVNSIDTKDNFKELTKLRNEILEEYRKIFDNGLEDINKIKD